MSGDKAEATGLRIDKWLWYARFFKSRSLATDACKNGRIRVNKDILKKAAGNVAIGDVLTFSQGREVRVVEVAALGTRRGPASEAQALYKDLAPIDRTPKPKPVPTALEQAKTIPVATREAGSGRPTKRERRTTEKLIGRLTE